VFPKTKRQAKSKFNVVVYSICLLLLKLLNLQKIAKMFQLLTLLKKWRIFSIPVQFFTGLKYFFFVIRGNDD
jgi:hypothetical protein